MITWNPVEYARNSTAQKRWAAELLAHLDLKGDEEVLDLGYGDGKITAAIAQAVPYGRAVGIDSSEEMIRYAQAQYPTSDDPKMVFQLLDVRALDYTDEFDLVVSNAALHWVQDHRAILAGAHRALRQGGRLALSFGGKGNAAVILEVGFTVGHSPEWRDFFQGYEPLFILRNPRSTSPGWTKLAS